MEDCKRSKLTDGSSVCYLVWTAFRATAFHGFDQFTCLLPPTFGTAAIDGRRITVTVWPDSIFVHLLEEFQCLWPEFFVDNVATAGSFGTGYG